MKENLRSTFLDHPVNIKQALGKTVRLKGCEHEYEYGILLGLGNDFGI